MVHNHSIISKAVFHPINTSQTGLICNLHAFAKNETLHNASDIPAAATPCTLARADMGSPVHNSEHCVQLGLGTLLLVLSRIMA